MAKLRLGIVGCGDIAQYVAWFARLNRDITLAAACDVVPARAAGFARRFRIPWATTSYAALLARGELDAVYLAVPHHLHFGMVAAAVARGLPVLVEKPVARTLVEGEALARLAAARGVKVGVNYQYRYDSGGYALARALQQGALGRIAAVRINVPWKREAGYFRDAGWHARLATAGGGTLLTQGSHFLDLVLWGLGRAPRTAAAYTRQFQFRDVEVEDITQAILELADGTLVNINSMMVASSEQPATVEVYGERGTALYRASLVPRLSFRDVRVRQERPPHRGVHALQRSLEGFRAWVLEDTPYLIPVEEGLTALAAVTAVYRAARSGRREPVTG